MKPEATPQLFLCVPLVAVDALKVHPATVIQAGRAGTLCRYCAIERGIYRDGRTPMQKLTERDV